MAAPLLLCDTPGLLYRGFFALPDSIKGAEGRPVNALVGSVNMTLWCIEKYKPRAVVMCFGQESARLPRRGLPGLPRGAARRCPTTWPGSGSARRTSTRRSGWTVLGHESLEADDLMGSLAALETEAGGDAMILTADRDMFQCANEHVTILLQRARQQGPDEVGPDGVREIYGIDPEQVPDFIALRGDPSDGLPGAKGIGAKTAADLLRRKGDLEHVILGAIRETPSVRKALIEQAAELRTFRDIATLRSIPVERPPDAPTDYAGGAEGGRGDRDGPAREAAQRRGSARLSRSNAVSPTQWAAPTAIGEIDRVAQALGRAVGAGRGRWRAAARAARRPPSARPRRRRAGSRRAAARSPSAVPSGTTIRTSAKSRP